MSIQTRPVGMRKRCPIAQSMIPWPGQGPTQHRIERGVTGRPPRTVQRTSDAQVPFVGRTTDYVINRVVDFGH